MILTLFVEGLGIGLVNQPTLVAIIANSACSDRAVVTGFRNFMRNMGGAFGLVISGAILANTLNRDLAHMTFKDDTIRESLFSSIYSLDGLTFSKHEKELVLNAYMGGLQDIFIMYSAGAAVNLLLCYFIGNTPLENEKSSVSLEDGKNDTAPPIEMADYPHSDAGHPDSGTK